MTRPLERRLLAAYRGAVLLHDLTQTPLGRCPPRLRRGSAARLGVPPAGPITSPGSSSRELIDFALAIARYRSPRTRC